MNFYKDILTVQQIDFLNLFSQRSSQFYLSGGTALVAFYLNYRFSDDLDFFSESEVDLASILSLIKSSKKNLGYVSLDIRTVNNRNLIFLEFPNKYTLKLEFTYYPFPQIDTSQKYNQLPIDSVEDIATNKLFTIYQSPRYRDFTDLYSIINKYGYSISDLISKAKIKFDWHVDPFMLGKRFMTVKERHDAPRMISEFGYLSCENYFLNEAVLLGKSVLD